MVGNTFFLPFHILPYVKYMKITEETSEWEHQLYGESVIINYFVIINTYILK